ncbi:uncharacterized protein FOMMEDRAFT_96132 [Fomitiporia mediterranea MF3/22]|uniref:uncharacterized protein n=1 Tax=Fomitiporia mediterranea (strain MF3/22) TaxID=694068 RepID=UPI0004408315|nr:uncharacterized protein FOMMEDRAFT_96132 [Fomitiporia mediterranea MF3/22]EJC98638.1 hypothetical protein FOMMEDRAFT_96132 [Fomitiporia mediterranea MF3/22]
MSSESSQDLLTLTLTPDNPVNTTLTNQIYYTSETLYPRGPKSSYAITHVCGKHGETLGALEWRDVRSDLVGLGGEGEFPLSAWMNSSLIPFNSCIRKYKWKGCGTGESMELWVEDAPDSPIAQFQKSRPRADPSTPARLLITPRAQEIMDTVVISFLFLEKRRRATENSTQNRADVLGTPALNLPGTSRLRTQVVNNGV